MTKIKLCGLSRPCDIEAVNKLQPSYIGFVFAPKSIRYVSMEKAAGLKELLSPSIKAVGVFVREDSETVAGLLRKGTIDIAQLHGGESEEYIKQLQALTDKPIIKAFRIDTEQDVEAANKSIADYVLLDSGQGGTGTIFDWNLLGKISRPYFLAGGLNTDNVHDAIERLHPYAVDVSSGIETDGYKDSQKMEHFVRVVRTCTPYGRSIKK
ncbi:MAG: phosphoribosylanthranilate isomerase [Lachnospiraceae bacterium]|nr:phosphoribosylanthranilate isomerase [Lachnospiraceae bacterium]